ncbi:MAG TPA: phosphohydrolase, partial [Cyclobacteriaceae bacterium]|nr:phosphohydrolase [Cyclobacteriaceae bacterium]
AQYLVQSGQRLTCSNALSFFIENSYTLDDFKQKKVLESFGRLDDNDIWGAIKIWQNHPDKILSTLCLMLLERRLFRVTLTSTPIQKKAIETVRSEITTRFKVLRKDASFLFSHGVVSNEAYISEGKGISILTRKGELVDIAQASDLPNVKALSKIVKKSYLCYPKNVSLSRN